MNKVRSVVPECSVPFSFYWLGQLFKLNPCRLFKSIVLLAIGILHTFQPNLFSNPGGQSMYTSSYKSIGESIPLINLSLVLKN